jgi:ATP-binding cassette subfamily B protein
MNNTKKEKYTLFLKFVNKYKFSFLNLFICIVFTSISGSLQPFIFGVLIDDILYSNNYNFFLFIILLYIVIFISEQTLRFILNTTWSYLKVKFLYDIKELTINSLLLKKSIYFNTCNSGDIITIINKDVEEFLDLIHWNVFFLFGTVLKLLISIIIIFKYNTYIGLMVAILIPVSVIISKNISKVGYRIYKKNREDYSQYISWLFEVLKNYKDIIIYSAQKFVKDRFDKQIKVLNLNNFKIARIEYFSNRIDAALTLLTSILIYSISGYFAYMGLITLGSFMSIIEYFRRSTGFLKGINESILSVKKNLVSIDKVMNILCDADRESIEYDVSYSKLYFDSISFSNVYFKYNNDKFVLNNFSLKILKGEKIAIVGKSGAGKSTIISLLLKLYDNYEGDIFLGKNNLKSISTKYLRDKIGVVSQDYYIFNASIKDNICCGKSDYSNEEIKEACKKAQILETIEKLPLGLETILGENGFDLSGGQKQRIILARLFLKNPDILVLDEATSSLDSYIENDIINECMKQFQDKTIIIIAHRLSTILSSEKVAVIKDGVLVGYDKHSVLLNICDEYYKLFHSQYFL